MNFDLTYSQVKKLKNRDMEGMSIKIPINEFSNYSETSYVASCPSCDKDLWISTPEIGDEAYCDRCDKTFEVDEAEN